MKNQTISLLFLALLCFFGPGVRLACAQQPAQTIASLTETIDALKTQIEELRSRRVQAEIKVSDYEARLADQENELAEELKRSLDDPLAENASAIANRKRQIELVELKLKSRVATIVRLESKEQDLLNRLERSTKSLQRAELADRNRKKWIAKSKARNKANAAKKPKPIAKPIVSNTKVSNTKVPNTNTKASNTKASNTKASRTSAEAKTPPESLRPKPETNQPNNASASSTSNNTADALSIPEAVPSNIDVGEPKPKPELETKTKRVPALSGADKIVVIGATGRQLSKAQQRALDVMDDVKQKLIAGKGKSELAKVLILSGSGVVLQSPFEHLGAQQYRAQAVVRAGKRLIFKVDQRSFRLTIPDNDAGEMYMFFYDVSDPESVRLYGFRRSLVDVKLWQPELDL